MAATQTLLIILDVSVRLPDHIGEQSEQNRGRKSGGVRSAKTLALQLRHISPPQPHQDEGRKHLFSPGRASIRAGHRW